MCLDGALANKLCRARNLRLASRYRRHAFGSGQIKLKRRHGGHGFRLLDLHEHVDHPVLKHLEARNWLTELVTLAGIFERALMQLSGHTAGFCADCYGCFVDDAFDKRQACAFVAQQGIARYCGIFKVNFRRLKTIYRWVIAADNTFCARVDQEQRHAVYIGVRAAGACGDE